MSAPEGQVEAVDQEILALLPIHRASGKRCAQRRHVAAGGSISREATSMPSPKGPREHRKRPPTRYRNGRRHRISSSMMTSARSEEHTYELQSLMPVSNAVYGFTKN